MPVALQTWAAIVVLAVGLAMIWLPLGVIAFGLLAFVDALGRDLDRRRKG